MAIDRLGKVVWHDLLTMDKCASEHFYERVAGWRYIVEHATDFAWGGGERDFILAMLDGEAGAGLLVQSEVRFEGWVPYVEVEDIHHSTQIALDLGGSVVKSPFDVPGVGSNCLLRDPLGAFVGIAVSEHDYPIPEKQFASDCYLLGSGAFPAEFYQRMFGWRLGSEKDLAASTSEITFEGTPVGFCAQDQGGSRDRPAWLPVLRVGELAESLNQVAICDGAVLDTYEALYGTERIVLARDQTGHLFLLTQRSTRTAST